MTDQRQATNPSALLEDLVRITGTVAGREVGPDEDLFRILNDSLELMSLAAAIEYELDQRLDLLDLLDHPSCQRLANHLSSIGDTA